MYIPLRTTTDDSDLDPREASVVIAAPEAPFTTFSVAICR